MRDGWDEFVPAAMRVGPDELPAVLTDYAPAVRAVDLVVYVVDYGQAVLIPLVRPGRPAPAPLPVQASLAGRAFTRLQPQVEAGRLWVPLVDGADRLGVLEFVTGEAADPVVRGRAVRVAALVSQLLLTRHQYGDFVERVRRRVPMQLAAEIVWSLLPPLTFATDAMVVTGILEPCYDMGGDVFDYALNAGVLSVGLFDAVGHGMAASSLATLVIGAYRNGRRCGLDLGDTARGIDKWIRTRTDFGFASAVLAELDTRTGVLRYLTAGHPAPLLLRGGQLTKHLEAPTGLPLGLGDLSPEPSVIAEESLQPGDRLLLYTDGVIEARDKDGAMFGIDRLVDFVTRALAAGLPTPEAMRRLVTAITDHQEDELQDDASAVFIEWRPSAAALP